MKNHAAQPHCDVQPKQETVSKESYDAEYFARKDAEFQLYKAEQERCEDAISRQAALDLCERFGGSVPYSVLSDYDLLPPVDLEKLSKTIYDSRFKAEKEGS